MKMLFALVSAVFALAVMLVLLGFLQNWLPMPWGGIDVGPLRSWPQALAINLLLIALFAGSHSVMARPAFKRWWTRFVPQELERSVYLLVSGLTLGLLCLYWSPMPAPVWSVELPAARLLIHALFLVGVLLVQWATFSIEPLHFYGLRQVAGPARDIPFTLRGPYHYVRHPIQTGVIVVVWATPDMSAGHLLLALVFTAYSVWATLRLEEPDLVAVLGERYRDYQRRVPALLPTGRRR